MCGAVDADPGRRGKSILNDSFNLLLPDLSDPVAQPYWQGLAEGALNYQSCESCGHRWLPARAHCPHCLSDKIAWSPAQGRASLISWVVFHRAYHPAFSDQIPYAVAIVELEEGPRMFARLQGRGNLEAFKIGEPLRLKVKDVGPIALPHFEPASSSN